MKIKIKNQQTFLRLPVKFLSYFFITIEKINLD